MATPIQPGEGRTEGTIPLAEKGPWARRRHEVTGRLTKASGFQGIQGPRGEVQEGSDMLRPVIPLFLCSGLSVELARLSGDAQWLWWNVQVKLTLSRLPIFLNRAVECDNGVCVQTIKRHYHTK
ncbi:hypothetical protein DBR06_SOUSAS4810011 [Sousa chinensis]|nr:hypothetical protein DBR06_SOUSAS4810011 [Sousa chinensis]